jgi:hypothetical protein
VTKDFTEVEFNAAQCQQELERFRDLLASREYLSERKDIQPLFKECSYLTAYLGTTFRLNIGIAQQIATEFEIVGDCAADIVLGNREREFCFVELEDGDPTSVLVKKARSMKEWGPRLEHGFSQLVDWFYLLDDFKQTARFQKNFGYGHIDFVGLLLIGRNKGLDDDDMRRFRWRKHKVVVDSHAVVCMTYDDLYKDLQDQFDLYAAAFKVEAAAKPEAEASE